MDPCVPGKIAAEPFEVEIARRRSGYDPASDFRAAGLQTLRIEPREVTEILGFQGFDHAAIQFLVNDKVAQTARRDDADAKILGIGFDERLQLAPELHTA